MLATKIPCPYVDLALQHRAIKTELLHAISEVIDSGQFILGPQVAEFEKQFAKLCKTKEVIGLNSGTDALIFALKAIGIGRGDEVITVPNSFVASTSCIEILGAKTVFVDITEDLNLDPSQLSQALSPRTKAIIPVHLTGRPAPMKPIMEFANKHSLYVIEDCAQAVDAEYDGQPVGSFGIAGCFSLHPLKTLNACGDGGLLTTNSLELAQKIRLLRNLGLQTRENCVEWSSNSRLDSIQAAILSVKLKYLPEWTMKRRQNAELYHLLLQDVKEIQLPIERSYEKCVYHTFVILAEKRDELRNFLESQGIGTAIHYPKPIHQQDVAKAYSHLRFPVTEKIAKLMVSLPIHQDMTVEQISFVAEMIHQFYNQGKLI